jgi:hypothetical protein
VKFSFGNAAKKAVRTFAAAKLMIAKERSASKKAQKSGGLACTPVVDQEKADWWTSRAMNNGNHKGREPPAFCGRL